MGKILFIITFTIITCGYAQEDYHTAYQYESIHDGWKIKKANDTSWIRNVEIIATIHEMLMNKEIIEHPYYGDNETKLKWVEETDWIAQYEFNYTDTTNYKNILLEIDGLSPFAKIYINNKFVFESSNAFTIHRIDIAKHLKFYETNKITIQFPSIVNKAKEVQQQNSIVLPGDERVFVRMPQHQFGWDWGPRFVSSGIKRGISILKIPFKTIQINSSRIIQKKVNDKIAELEIRVQLESPSDRIIAIKYGANQLKSKRTKKINLKKGPNSIVLPLLIESPLLWWPNGMGDQNFYSIGYQIESTENKSKKLHYKFSQLYGLFTKEFVHEKDSIGQSFYFKINGKPVYCKGFNFIPTDHFGENIWDNGEKNRKLIGQLRNMNCNMIRVWGGGEYMSNEFYEDCLTQGIMVWQDFMFACAMYPGNDHFLNTVANEIDQVTNRLANESNIVLWCGNNENDEGWKNWGWQKQFKYSALDSAKIWNDYLNLFHSVIPKCLNKNIQHANYIPSSPLYGWGRKESMTHGDSHYWGVWWGKEPIEKFNEKVPRFMSEFGMQAMPDLKTLQAVIPDTSLNFNSPAFKNHQKHPTGFETINHYLKTYLTIPKDLEDYVYVSQVMQAMTLEKAIEAQRISMPATMGTLIWQLNDTWPVTSWSVIDYYGNKKIAFNTVQSRFRNIILGVKENTSSYDIILINDFNTELNEKLEIEVMDLNGQQYFQKSVEINVQPFTTTLVYQLKKSELTNIDLASTLLKAEIKNSNIKKIYPFTIPNKVKYHACHPSITVKPSTDIYKRTNHNKTVENWLAEIEFTTFTPYVKLNDPENKFSNSFDRLNSNELNGETFLKGEKHFISVSKELFKSEDELINYIAKNLYSLNKILNPK